MLTLTTTFNAFTTRADVEKADAETVVLLAQSVFIKQYFAFAMLTFIVYHARELLPFSFFVLIEMLRFTQ